MAAGALLGTIALLWASVRTLSGDAPLGLDLEAVGAARLGVDASSEQKRRVLRALKDLEAEHAIGKIDEADYDTLVARYRDEAKTVMREMDLQVAPLRERGGEAGADVPREARPRARGKRVAGDARANRCASDDRDHVPQVQGVERARRGLLQEVRRPSRRLAG